MQIEGERKRPFERSERLGASAGEVLPKLFPRPLDAHQTMFAMGEAIAHFNRLVAAGRLVGHSDDAGVWRYAPA